MEYKIILNPVSGKGRGEISVTVIAEMLNKHKVAFEIVKTKEPFHAIELAKEAIKGGFKGIIAAGGDGTMGEVLNGVMENYKEGVHFGFIPTGTGNDFARSLNIPLDIRAAAELLAYPKVKTMDIGKDHQGYFAIITGVGFPAEVMAKANSYRGPLRGPLVITWSVIKTINELQTQKVEIIMDGEKMEKDIKAIFVLNTPFTGGGLNLVPSARVDDGFLDILVVTNISKLDLLMTLPKAYKGNHVGHPAMEFYRCKEIEVNTETPMRKLFDGNVFGSSPIKAAILPKALPVFLPEERCEIY